MLHDLYDDKRRENTTHAIATLNKNIRECKNTTSQQFGCPTDHDKFDPSGNVKWGDIDNSGFLFQSWKQGAQQYSDCEQQVIEKEQIAQAFIIGDRQEADDYQN